MKQKFCIAVIAVIILIAIGFVTLRNSGNQNQPADSAASIETSEHIAQTQSTAEEATVPAEQEDLFEDEPIPVTDSTKGNDEIDLEADDESIKEEKDPKPVPDNEEVESDENTTQTTPAETDGFFGGQFETGEDEF